MIKNVSGTLFFQSEPRIISHASAVGKKEAEGPLKNDFDKIIYDMYYSQDTYEKAESRFQQEAFEEALRKEHMRVGDIDIIYAGDLLNQCVASSFAMKSYGIPYVGIYGACSTMALCMISAACAVESGAARTAACAASSHYCTAERQYRFPLEYGSQRPPSAQWTVTGSGACIISGDSDPAAPRIHAATIGVINDMGVTDQNNMGAAMAPAAADTIYRFFSATNTDASDYDAIYTGDLGRVGSKLLYELLIRRGVDIESRHSDCGAMIYSEEQDVHAGGSGCGCCASVLCSHILNRMRAKIRRNILFIPTGALLSPTTTLQGESIPAVAHLVNIRI